MNVTRFLSVLGLVLMLIGQTLDAQPNEADRKEFLGTKARAQKGDAKAQTDLGFMYDKGNGVAKDETEAVKWYRKAADQGFSKAQYNLGWMYSNGRGVAINEAEALKWYRKAADQGDESAQLKVGMAYANGHGMRQEGAEAVKWYQEAEAAKWYRKAAEQGNVVAQSRLGVAYATGKGVSKSYGDALKWFRKAADQGDAIGQVNLGVAYANGQGVATDEAEAVRWYHMAAVQGYEIAQLYLGEMYTDGRGVAKDEVETLKWYRKAAEQGNAKAQNSLGFIYYNGQGVVKDEVEAYKWWLLAGAQAYENAKENIPKIEGALTPDQRAEGQRLAREFKPHKGPSTDEPISREGVSRSRPEATGTGFFITEDGYLITNEHVAGDGASVRVLTGAGILQAKIVKVDRANDLALLKVEGKFAALPIAASRTVKLGGTVATVGFPNIGLQGFAPKLAKGEIASLSGAQDDARYFQISVPVQPGNSGGALVDERGNVVGVVSAKLNARAALSTSGALPENVNYAVKSSYLLSFLESVPEVAARLRGPESKERKFEDVVRSAEQAAVLVLVY